MPPIWVGFWVQNYLNKGPFFGRLSLDMGGFPEVGKKLAKNCQKLLKMDNFPPKVIIKVGMTATEGN